MEKTTSVCKIESVMFNHPYREDTRLNSLVKAVGHIYFIPNAKHDLVKLKLTSSKDTIIK